LGIEVFGDVEGIGDGGAGGGIGDGGDGVAGASIVSGCRWDVGLLECGRDGGEFEVDGFVGQVFEV